MKPKHVVIDASALRTRTRQRGIGRYVFDLLHGLAAVRSEAPELRLSALVGWSALGRPLVTTDLAAAADDTVAQPLLSDASVWSRRRLLLGASTYQAGGDLLFMPEMRGTPIVPVPLVVTCHDMITLRYPEHYLGSHRRPDGTWAHSKPFAAYRYLRDLRRYRLARRVVAISRRTAADVAEILGVPDERIDVVREGIFLDRYREQKSQRMGLKPFVVYVGYCDYRKNIETMLDALGEVRRDHDVELRWAGDIVGPDRARIDAAIAERGLTGHVHILGFVSDDDLVALYQQALGLVFLSRLEGFGLPVAEAMASGCPVLVAADSGTDELAGDAGAIVAADDVRGAAEAIRSWIDEPAVRAEHRRRGLERAQGFDHAEQARGYLASYRRALGV